MGKTRTTQKLSTSQFTSKYEHISGAYTRGAGRKGVKITLQEVFIYESKAPSELLKLCWNTTVTQKKVFFIEVILTKDFVMLYMKYCYSLT